MAELAKSDPTGRRMIGIQKYTYLPLLCIARFSWLQQGITYAWNITVRCVRVRKGAGGGRAEEAGPPFP